MNEVITQTLYFVASYVGIIIFFFFSVNWLSNGWLSTFLRVKASRGKKSMTIVHGIADTYYRVGRFEKGGYRFKDKDGQGRTLTSVNREDVLHITGVTGIEVDGLTGTIIKRGHTKPGCSPIDTDNFLERIIKAPKHDDNIQKIILILLAVTVLILIGLSLAMFNLTSLVTKLQASGVIQ